MRAAGFVGKETPLADLDLLRIEHTIGVGEGEIHAAIEVEATGGCFDKRRRPKMLLESHLLYRNLTGADRTRAVSAGLAYARLLPTGRTPSPAASRSRTRRPVPLPERLRRVLERLAPRAGPP